MKNYLNKSAFKGIKSELTVKYGVGKSEFKHIVHPQSV